MRIQVQVKGLVRATKLRSFAIDRLRATLGRFDHAVREVNVRMHDINGPNRGGVDKLCRVVLRLRDDSVLVIEELGASTMESIHRAADRVHHAVGKQVDRMAKVGKQGMRPNNLATAMA